MPTLKRSKSAGANPAEGGLRQRSSSGAGSLSMSVVGGEVRMASGGGEGGSERSDERSEL